MVTKKSASRSLCSGQSTGKLTFQWGFLVWMVSLLSRPPGWDQKDQKSYNERIEVTDEAVKDSLQSLMNVSYKNVWTRDRRKTGKNKVPKRYELVRALHSENYKDWKGYYLKRHQIKAHVVTMPHFKVMAPLTAGETAAYERHEIDTTCNEWLLFHGTNSDSAEKIAKGDFTMRLAGSNTGTLYGGGTYFADSITKADEYADLDEDDNCCVLVCRALGGHVLYNDEITPDADNLQRQVVDDAYDSIIGDREKCRGTYKEYILFDADQVYVEYIVIYKRIY